MSTAIEKLKELTQQTVLLGDVGALDCDPDELRAAAPLGLLVSRVPKLKLQTERGPVLFDVGEVLPPLPAEHRLCATPNKWVTTLERWQNNRAWKAAAMALEASKPWQVRLRHATHAVDAAGQAVDAAKAAWEQAKADLKAAELEVKLAESELLAALAEV